jgi:hypothetical protein
MWQAIGLVTSGLALVAFAIAAVAWLLKSRAEIERRVVERAEPSDLPEVLKTLKTPLDGVEISTNGLSGDAIREIALAKIQVGAARYRHNSIVVGFVAILIAIVAVLSIWLSRERVPPVPGPDPEPRAVAELQLSIDSVTIGINKDGAYATSRLSIANSGNTGLLISDASLVVNAVSMSDGSILYNHVDLIHDKVLEQGRILPVSQLSAPLANWAKMGKAVHGAPSFRTHYFSFFLQIQATPADGSGRIWLDIEAKKPSFMTCDHDCVAVFDIKASAKSGQHLECEVLPSSAGFNVTCLEGKEPI